MADATKNIIDNLSTEISSDVGNMNGDELSSISDTFQQTLTSALKVFNSSTFDDDGFIKKMRNLDIDSKDKDVVKNVLNSLKNEYVDVSALNQSELLLRRDMFNICTQMPEMRDVIYVVRDAIIECNVSTGEVSRSISFENHDDNASFEAQAKEIETKYDLLMAIKNFIVPKTLMAGEMYIQVVPYAKLFAELDAIKQMKGTNGIVMKDKNNTFHESVPAPIMKGFTESKSLYNEENLKTIMESVNPITKIESSDIYKMSSNTTKERIIANSSVGVEKHTRNEIKTLLENIEVCNGSSVMLQEMGSDALQSFILQDYKEHVIPTKVTKETHFSESMKSYKEKDQGKPITEALAGSGLGTSQYDVDEDDINTKPYAHIKGCYVKYLDSLRMIPIRMDRKVIGYYYITTTMDLTVNPAQPNGFIDLSFQAYTRDRTLVDNLASMIMKNFDKKMLEKNIKLKSEIAEVIMAHKFSEGRLSFIYIPENEVVRLIINEDENGKGHGILEPTLFPARMYLMLNLYNMLYILNNNTTRIHYLRSSGMNKDYAAQIQRAMRKFQSRRITIDDIYSYQGVLNKVGGMGEMVLPSGRGDYKAIETDTIPAVDKPMDIEFLEQQRRQAISGTGAPHLLVINALDEVDFAKTLEMANARFLSTTSSYKIDFNRGLTKFYKVLMKYCTDLDDDVINSFNFQFNAAKQQELTITADMVNNFNAMFDMVSAVYYSKDEMETQDGKPTPKQMHLRKELAKEYLPQLDFDALDEIVKRVNVDAGDDDLQNRVSDIDITNKDLNEVEPQK